MHIGIIGGGQLARMLILAGTPLGLSFTCIDAHATCAAAPLAHILTPANDTLDVPADTLRHLHCLTYENENSDLEALAKLAQQQPLFPSIQALAQTQDRLDEKNFLNTQGIPTVAYANITDWETLAKFIEKVGYPLLLKTRRHGYDGKGQTIVHHEHEAKKVYASYQSQALIAEQYHRFDEEVSLISVRNRAGDIVFYPLVRNHHQSGILLRSEAPYLNARLQAQAEQIARTLLTTWAYVGVLTIEFFVRDEQLTVNEIAPRVHNSGHWTIEGALTSQFENHLRAIVGYPLGCTQARGPCVMLNVLGQAPAQLSRLLAIPDCHYHWYGKTPQAKRKLGHVTICAADQQTLAQRVTEAVDCLTEANPAAMAM